MSGGRSGFGGGFLAVVAGVALAADPQVKITCSTNVSTTVIVKTVGLDGEPSVQVFGSGAGAQAAAGAGEVMKATWLGVTTEAASDEVRAQLALDPGVGLTVFGVAPESPAAKAGLEKHDILVKFEEQLLMDPDQLRNLVRARQAGDKVGLTYLRKGKKATAKAVLGEREEAGEAGQQVISLGDMDIDLGTLLREAGKLEHGSRRTFHFATNWSFGNAGGGSVGARVITFGGDGAAGDLQGVLKGLKLDDTNLTRMVEEALKAAGQGQPGEVK